MGIDDGELDWKMIAVNSKDPKFASVNDVADVEREFPGEIQKILEWFRDYKIPDGNPTNAFGYDNKCMSAEFAMEIVDETNEFYNKLKSGERATRRSWPWSKAVGLDPASPPPPPEIIIAKKKKNFFQKKKKKKKKKKS